MKKLMTILGSFIIASVVLTSCGGKKSEERVKATVPGLYEIDNTVIPNLPANPTQGE